MYKNLGKNLIWSWGGHSVFIVAGFLIPRLMDHQLGTEVLGIWDFVFSFLAYLRLIQLDVGSSVNRYVAKYRSTNNIERTNQAVTSVFLLQLFMGLFILAATAIIVLIIPIFWSEKLGSFVKEVRILMTILGVSSALGLSLGAFSGVVTGCHRWDIYNGINSGCHAIFVVAMIISLKMGGGLVLLGILRFCETLLNTVLTIIAAYKVCPELKINLSQFRKSQALEMLGFGGKGFLISLSKTFFYQTNSFLIMTYLGPATLAIYSRPISLIQQAKMVAVKFAHILVPIISGLQDTASEKEMKHFVLTAAFYGAIMALPIVGFLAIMGGPVLEFWMGARYNNPMLIGILAIGHLFSIGNLPLQTMIMGINVHGFNAFVSCIASLISIILTYILLNINPDVMMVAISVASTLLFLEGVFLIFYTCSKFKLSKLNFITQVWGRAFLCVLPFLVCLSILRALLDPVNALLFGIIGGGLILSITYYIYVLPEKWKINISKRLLSFKK